MAAMEPITDPFGNDIYLHHWFYSGPNAHRRDVFTATITTPSFVIAIRDQELYFFRPLTNDINLVVHARKKEGLFFVVSYFENPTVDDISAMLEKGRLFSFSANWNKDHA